MSGTGKYENLLLRCASLDPVPTAVAHPCEASALAGALEAGEKGLITPILVGPAAKIQQVAEAAGLKLGNVRHRDEHELTHCTVELGQISKQNLDARLDQGNLPRLMGPI